MDTPSPTGGDPAGAPPACPLVCGPAALIRWGARRFPHAARAGALVATALLFAAAANLVHPLGIRWRPSADGRVGIPRAYESRLPQIGVEEALSHFHSGQALFVDSRDEEDFDEDHIPGAINVPMREWNVIWPEMQSQVPRDRLLVLYCYGGHCGLSTRQGKRLIAKGYDRLLVIDHGWEGWTKAGYPTERHPRGKAG